MRGRDSLSREKRAVRREKRKSDPPAEANPLITQIQIKSEHLRFFAFCGLCNLPNLRMFFANRSRKQP